MRLSYILLLLLTLLSLGSCRKAKLISRDDFADIYAEMFLVDQQLEKCPYQVRRMADTSAVYAPIFEKYGHTAADFQFSQEYYLRDAQRYARMLKRAIAKLEKEKKQLDEKLLEVDRNRMRKENTRRFIPDTVYALPTLDTSLVDIRNFRKMLKEDAEI